MKNAPATKADVTAVRTDLTTVTTKLKDEIAAVKTELKDEIAAVKTELKDEIAAVEKRLDNKIARVAVEVVKTQAELGEIKHTMATSLATKEDVNRIMSAIDAFAQKAERYDRKAVFHGHRLDEHEDTLKDHAARIAGLESRRP